MEVFPSLHSIFINYNSNLLAPVASFAKMVETGLLAAWAEQHAPNTCLSKFEQSVTMNLMPISCLFWVATCFLLYKLLELVKSLSDD